MQLKMVNLINFMCILPQLQIKHTHTHTYTFIIPQVGDSQ